MLWHNGFTSQERSSSDIKFYNPGLYLPRVLKVTFGHGLRVSHSVSETEPEVFVSYLSMLLSQGSEPPETQEVQYPYPLAKRRKKNKIQGSLVKAKQAGFPTGQTR